MVARRPVVVISGQQTELPPGDSIVGGSVGTLTAGSGLNGGGDLSSTTVTNVSLAPNPSGLILVDNKYLATDGVAQRTAETALASGNYALAAGTAALASGIAGSTLAATALASGNAALADIAAIPGGTIERFTAASAVASGYAVGLDDVGRVQSVREVDTGTVRVIGSPSTFQTSTTIEPTVVYDSLNNKFVISYREDNGVVLNGRAVVGTVTSNSISFGTPVTYSSNSNVQYIGSVFDPVNNKVVIFYQDGANSNFGTAIVGTVSGTSISFGTAVVFESATTQPGDPCFDLTNNKIVLPYKDSGNSNYGTAIVGTVSGTSISFGTPVVFNSNTTNNPSSTFSSGAGKVAIAYRDVGGTTYGTAIIGTVSGTSISFGTPTAITSNFTEYHTATYDPVADKVIFAYYDGANTYGTAIVGTITGTTISFGTPVIYNSTSTNPQSLAYDSKYNKVLLVYNGLSGAGGNLRVGTVSGTTISFSNAVQFNTGNTPYVGLACDPNTGASVIGYQDPNTSNYGRGKVSVTLPLLYPTISSQTNFIGIAQDTAASGTTVPVRLPGSYDQNNTGLTPGAVYYINPTISGFTTTATQPSAWSGAVNWGPIGRAVNSTTLLLTDMI